jgi:hypothetical protein
MSDTVTLSTFPANRTEALTLLYLQNQNLTNVTPEQLADLYKETQDRIHKAFTKGPNPGVVRVPI